ncbi:MULTISPECIES: DUF2867 domain-containing protein [Actinosynnema]|uniref:DUF2867 domain-containing protein n=1 Tax=Actinosynnema TaxID=40566 RepID=UPI0020A56845|nr:DUF2867 domain-containing protein [Actinosynnema pretiosum]MCP2096196.1 Protein of unknown function (DUF2867) [Actinosynnema pretiosum]
MGDKSTGARLPDNAYSAMPWRIREVTDDFHVHDVWRVSTPGAGPDDFPAMHAAMRRTGGVEKQKGLVKLLFTIRWKLGALLRLDDRPAGASLATRLPAALTATTTPQHAQPPFTPLYDLPTEAASEIVNRSVHAVMHLGWVPSTTSADHELRLTVLVKTRGRLGRAYLSLIGPFRHTIVYPALTRRWERAWRERPR